MWRCRFTEFVALIWWDNSGDNLSIEILHQDKYNKLIKTETVQLTNGTGDGILMLFDNEWGRLSLFQLKDTGECCGVVAYMLLVLVARPRLLTLPAPLDIYHILQIKVNTTLKSDRKSVTPIQRLRGGRGFDEVLRIRK